MDSVQSPAAVLSRTPVGVAATMLAGPGVPRNQSITVQANGQLPIHTVINPPQELGPAHFLLTSPHVQQTHVTDLTMRGVRLVLSDAPIAPANGALTAQSWLAAWPALNEAGKRAKLAEAAFRERGVSGMNLQVVDELYMSITSGASYTPMIATALTYVYSKAEFLAARPNCTPDLRGYQYRPVAQIPVRVMPRADAYRYRARNPRHVEFIDGEGRTAQEIKTLIMFFRGIRGLTRHDNDVAAEPDAIDQYGHAGAALTQEMTPQELAAAAPPGGVAPHPPQVAVDGGGPSPVTDAQLAALAHILDDQNVMGHGFVPPEQAAGPWPTRAARSSIRPLCSEIVVVRNHVGGQWGDYRPQPAVQGVVVDAALLAEQAITAAQPLAHPDAILRLLIEDAERCGYVDQLTCTVGMLSRMTSFHGMGLLNHCWRNMHNELNVGRIDTARSIDPVDYVEERVIDAASPALQLWREGSVNLYLTSVFSQMQEGAAISVYTSHIATGLRPTPSAAFIRRQSAALIAAAAVRVASGGKVVAPWHNALFRAVTFADYAHSVPALNVSAPPGFLRPEILDVFPDYDVSMSHLAVAVQTPHGDGSVEFEGSPVYNGLFQSWFNTLSGQERNALEVAPLFSTRRGGSQSWADAVGVHGARLGPNGVHQHNRYVRLFAPRGETLPSMQNLPHTGPAGQRVAYRLRPRGGADVGLAVRALHRLRATAAVCGPSAPRWKGQYFEFAEVDLPAAVVDVAVDDFGPLVEDLSALILPGAHQRLPAGILPLPGFGELPHIPQPPGAANAPPAPPGPGGAPPNGGGGGAAPAVLAAGNPGHGGPQNQIALAPGGLAEAGPVPAPLANPGPAPAPAVVGAAPPQPAPLAQPALGAQLPPPAAAHLGAAALPAPPAPPAAAGNAQGGAAGPAV